MRHAREPACFHETRDSVGARVAADGRGNISVRVGIAVQEPAKRAADDRQVGEIDRANERIRGTVEIERQRAAAGFQHANHLVDGGCQIRHVPQPVPGGNQIERRGRERQRDHVSHEKVGRSRGPGLPLRQLNHSSGDVEAHDAPRTPADGERDIAGSCREIECARSIPWRGELHDAPLPCAIESVRQHDGNQIVAIRNRGEERAHVAPLAFGRGNPLVEHPSHNIACMLPSSTVENYLKAIYQGQLQLARGARLVSMGQVAGALGVTPGTATTMVKALAEAGLAEYEPYSGVRLTPAGEKLAGLVLRRHRLVELFLVRVMGMNWDEVHEEAEQLEHVVSDRLIDRIDAMLGQPTHDPHGDPIPTAEGTLMQPQLESLLTCPVGVRLKVTRIADQDPAFLRFIESNNLKPGQAILVEGRDTAADSVRIGGAGRQSMTIGARAASKLLVEADH